MENQLRTSNVNWGYVGLKVLESLGSLDGILGTCLRANIPREIASSSRHTHPTWKHTHQASSILGHGSRVHLFWGWFAKHTRVSVRSLLFWVSIRSPYTPYSIYLRALSTQIFGFVLGPVTYGSFHMPVPGTALHTSLLQSLSRHRLEQA